MIMDSSVPAIQERFTQQRIEELRRLLSEHLITAWANDPQIGHQEPLSWVLRLLDQRPAAERVTVLESVPGTEWRIVKAPDRRGTTYRLADRRRFSTEAQAQEARLRRELYDVFGWGSEPIDAVDGPELIQDQPVLLGYADRVSAAPGDPITFRVSAEQVTDYDTDLVRLRHIDDNPDGPGVRIEQIPHAWQGRHTGQVQCSNPGSHVAVSDTGGATAGDAGFTLACFIYPTCYTGSRQIVAGRWDHATGGYALGLDENGQLCLWLADAEREEAVKLGSAPGLNLWHGIAASYDPSTGRVALASRPLVTSVNSRLSPAVVDDAGHHVEQTVPLAGLPSGPGELFFGTLTPETGHFNGKIENPGIWPHPLPAGDLLAAVADDHDAPLQWRFDPPEGAGNAAALTVPCVNTPELDGRLVNLPMRGVTGRHYTAHAPHYSMAPREYAAMHFHDDAVTDAGWEPSHRFRVPETLPSGVYALRVTAADGSCQRSLPFVVRPPRGTATADLALLLPTATYLAYSNERALGHVSLIHPGNLFLERRYDLGHSLYARHTDGSGVCYVTWQRPIMTITPGFQVHLSPFTLTIDLYIMDWLTEMGYTFDVICDHDLHAEGADLINRYRAVVTGSHPEYASEQMLDALESYVDGGGNLGYLGGNGYYWSVSFHPQLPHVMELRRGENGTRSWQANPGEYHHATTGEPGGLWVNRSRPPQKIFGIGFTAQGGAGGGYYRLGPDIKNAEVSTLLDGVPDVFGDEALGPRAAAGGEIDRYDPALGSPPDAQVLATSEGVADDYQVAVEELGGTHPGHGGTEDPDVRSDIVYFGTRGGGSVFSTGAIDYSTGLSVNDYDNGLSRLTRNILDRWLDTG